MLGKSKVVGESKSNYHSPLCVDSTGRGEQIRNENERNFAPKEEPDETR
jgi:hypothetical protein